MSKDTTEIHVILDRSGSMYGVVTDIIGGYNKFLTEQKAEKGKATLSLVQFDDKYETVYEGKPIKDVQALDLTPRGSTALLDGVGKSIANTIEVCIIITNNATVPCNIRFFIKSPFS